MSPIVTGIVYCGVILACEEIYELRRAQEWTAVLARWCEQQPDLVVLAGFMKLVGPEFLGRFAGRVLRLPRVAGHTTAIQDRPHVAVEGNRLLRAGRVDRDELLAVDRENERHNAEAAATTGVAPRPSITAATSVASYCASPSV